MPTIIPTITGVTRGKKRFTIICSDLELAPNCGVCNWIAKEKGSEIEKS